MIIMMLVVMVVMITMYNPCALRVIGVMMSCLTVHFYWYILSGSQLSVAANYFYCYDVHCPFCIYLWHQHFPLYRIRPA